MSIAEYITGWETHSDFRIGFAGRGYATLRTNELIVAGQVSSLVTSLVAPVGSSGKLYPVVLAELDASFSRILIWHTRSSRQGDPKTAQTGERRWLVRQFRRISLYPPLFRSQ